MKQLKSSGSVRKVMTRLLATGALFALYGIGTAAVTGVALTAASTSATAHKGKRGGARGGGGGGGGSARGGGGGGGGSARGGRGGGGGARGGGRRRNNAGAAAVGTAIGIIGGVIATEAARRQDAVDFCFRRWGNRFNPDTMTVYRNGRDYPCP
jgi:hypothetical protein